MVVTTNKIKKNYCHGYRAQHMHGVDSVIDFEKKWIYMSKTDIYGVTGIWSNKYFYVNGFGGEAVVG